MPGVSSRTEVHSIRVKNGVWIKARKRAKKEGIAVSRVAGLLIEGYALGQISPRVELTFEGEESDD